VLDFIEATPPPGFQIPAPPIEKQADNINEQFVQRYTHMQERSDGQFGNVLRRAKRTLGL